MKGISRKGGFQGVCIGILCLAGCNFWHKEKSLLQGKRVPMVPVVSLVPSSLAFGPSFLGRSMALPWNQPGATPAHTMGPFSLGNRPMVQWKVSGLSKQYRIPLAPIAAAQSITLLTSQGTVLSLTPQGKVLWEVSLGSSITNLGGGIARDDRRVYITTPDGELVCVEANSGKILWRKSLPAPARNGPCLEGDHLAILTVKNTVLLLDRNTGSEIWQHTGLGEETSILGGSVPAMAQDRIVAACSSGEVVALGRREGEVLWSHNASSLHKGWSGLPHIHALPIVHNHCVYVLSHSGQLACLDLYTGNLQWTYEVGGDQTPSISGRVLFCLTRESKLVALDCKNGHLFWEYSLPQGSWMGPLVAGQWLYVLNREGELRVLDALQKGRCIAQYHLHEPCGHVPVAAYGGIVILSQKGTLFFLKTH